MIIQLIRIGYNHDTGRKFGNLIVVLNQGLRNFQLGFSSKIEVPQLGSARLGTLIARLSSSGKIPAQTHLYYIAYIYSALECRIKLQPVFLGNIPPLVSNLQLSMIWSNPPLLITQVQSRFARGNSFRTIKLSKHFHRIPQKDMI